MPYISCPGGLASLWKTKSGALKWLKTVNTWPCGETTCTDKFPCYRGSAFVRVKLTGRKGYYWSAQVWCLCPPPLVETEGSVVEWAPVGTARKRSRKRASAK